LPQSVKDIAGPGASDIFKTFELISKAPWTKEERDEWMRSVMVIGYNMKRGFDLAAELTLNTEKERIPIKLGDNTIEYISREDAKTRMVANLMSAKTTGESKEQTHNSWMLAKSEEFKRRREVLTKRLLNATEIEERARILKMMVDGGYYDAEAVKKILKSRYIPREIKTFKTLPKPTKYEYIQERPR
jgi:hypothetical protein